MQLDRAGRGPRLTPIIRRLTAPVRVAVRGRDGVGRTTVAAALAGAGVTVSKEPADVDVLVIAETLKPEDREVLAGAKRPAVVVLNKADLTGFGADGPVALAHRRAAQIRALTGLPTVPMIALLADVELSDDLFGALRTLVTEPADLTSTDGFVQSPHPLSTESRAHLLAALDRFGIAHAVLAIDRGMSAAALPAHLRRLSELDRVVEHVQAAGAPLRYRRLRSVMTELCAVAAQFDATDLAELLASDDSVLAMMTAAVDVVEAAGLAVDRGDDSAAHLRRAVHWRRYGRGPVDALHRACSADISRGSLRLLARSR